MVEPSTRTPFDDGLSPVHTTQDRQSGRKVVRGICLSSDRRNQCPESIQLTISPKPMKEQLIRRHQYWIKPNVFDFDLSLKGEILSTI